MYIALLNEKQMITGFKTEDETYEVVIGQEFDVTNFNPQPTVNDFIINNAVIKPVEIATLKDNLIADVRFEPNTMQTYQMLGPDEFDTANVSPKPEKGWRHTNNNGNSSFAPNTKIHKAYFINRLKPWWSDIKAARANNQEIDNDFEMFNEYTHVDFSFPDTMVMIPRLVAAVLEINPQSSITQEAIQANIEYYEAYKPAVK